MSASQSHWYKGEYPPSLVEAVAMQDLLCKLGYIAATEIFLGLDSRHVFVQLRADGLNANLLVGVSELPVGEMVKKWKMLVGEWNTGGAMSPEEKDELWETSETRKKLVEIVTTLTIHGFRRQPLDPAKSLKLN